MPKIKLDIHGILNIHIMRNYAVHSDLVILYTMSVPQVCSWALEQH